MRCLCCDALLDNATRECCDCCADEINAEVLSWYNDQKIAAEAANIPAPVGPMIWVK